MTFLTVAGLLVLLFLVVWAVCWLAGSGDLIGFLLAMDLSELIGHILRAIINTLSGD